MERGHLEDLDVDGRIILKWTSVKYDGMAWTGVLCLRLRTADKLS
jgi:hypothetical protein